MTATKRRVVVRPAKINWKRVPEIRGYKGALIALRIDDNRYLVASGCLSRTLRNQAADYRRRLPNYGVRVIDIISPHGLQDVDSTLQANLNSVGREEAVVLYHQLIKPITNNKESNSHENEENT